MTYHNFKFYPTGTKMMLYKGNVLFRFCDMYTGRFLLLPVDFVEFKPQSPYYLFGVGLTRKECVALPLLPEALNASIST